MSEGHEDVVTLRGERELVLRAGDLFAAAREEFLCGAADLVTWSGGVNAVFADGKRPPLRKPAPRDGLAMRKVYTRRALGDPYSERRLVAIAASGADVRISSAPLAREAIVIDRRIAVLAGSESRGPRTYTVVRVPEVVDGVRSLLYATWDAAEPLADALRASGPALDEEARLVLGALTDGLTDEAGARRLGMSLRTYRRRVAELMAGVGATSRFQAGVRVRGR
ncbi:DNA-binding response regulator [Streptomyces sp. AN091965]|uniref:DNA-binding response regulator n=1 Tax=Streptomyces sp. AN091965 TaxID=2927803 RepID=UPI001F60925E|nr:DNA-binding response regulator [Streptomyces sp. AN091965]MCI3933853.1 DNA-binding response regulator [Streptomyces sp. AN091965]